MAEKTPKQEKSKKPENEYTVPRQFVDDEPIVAAPKESQSWDEHEAACRILVGMVKDYQVKLESMVTDYAAIEGAALKAYKKMPNSDAMFSDSPLSPLRMQLALRQNLAKLGWKWAAGLPWGPDQIRPFFDIVKEACTWGPRIKKDQARREKLEAEERAARAKGDIGAIA